MAEIDNIVDYVIETPNNTNPSVLRSKLNTLVESLDPSRNDFVINYVEDSGDLDKTFQKILNAYNDGLNLVLKYKDVTCNFSQYYNDETDDTDYFVFAGLVWLEDNNSLKIYTIELSEDNTLDIEGQIVYPNVDENESENTPL